MENITNITCENEIPTEHDLALHIGAVFIVFTASLCGALCPILFGQIENKGLNRFLFIAKFFGAGVILCTGVCLILVNRQPNSLTTKQD